MQRFLIVVGLVLMAPALHGAPPFGGLKFNAYTTNDTATIDARVAGLAGVGGFQSGTNVTIWSTNINSTALTIRAAPGVLYGWTWTPSGLRSYWGSTNYTIALDASGDAYFTGDLFGRSFYGDDATRTRVNSARAVAASNIWDASNIKFWGAAGDANTDDTAIIKARIAATAGGMIKFPAGTYILSDTLLLTNVSVTLEGAEPVYDYDGTAIPSTVFKWASNPASGIGIIATNDGTYGAGIYGHIQNIGVDGNSVLGTGMLLSQAQLVDSCRVVNCTGAGINLTNSFNSTHISRTALVGNGIGLKLTGTAGTLASIEKCAIRLNSSHGILVENGSFVTLDRNVIESNAGHGLWLHTTTNYYYGGTPVGPIFFLNGWIEANAGCEVLNTTDTTNAWKARIDLENSTINHYVTVTNIMLAGTNCWITANNCDINWPLQTAAQGPTNELGGVITILNQNRIANRKFSELGLSEGGWRDDGHWFSSGTGTSNSASVIEVNTAAYGTAANPKVMGIDFTGNLGLKKARIVALDQSWDYIESELGFYVADSTGALVPRLWVDRVGKFSAYGDASITSNLVVGGGITSTGIVHRFDSGTANTLVITNGKSGFNVGNPQETLDAAATGSSLLKLTVTTPHSASAPAEVGLLLNSSVVGTEFPKGKIVGYEDNNNYASTELGVWLSDDTQALVPRLWINRSGYVGIGTTNPAAALDVNGGIRSGGVAASNVWDSSNVKFWGAVGDGVTDDTPAIQGLLNSAGRGGFITVPRGTYLLSQTLTSKWDNITLRGETSSGVYGDDTFGSTEFIWTNSSAGLVITNTAWLVENINFNGGGMTGDVVRIVAQNTFNHCQFNSGGVGIHFGDLVNSSELRDCCMAWNGTGFVSDGLNSTVWSLHHCRIRRNGVGAVIKSAAGASIDEETVIESNNGTAVSIVGTTNALIYPQQLTFRKVWIENNCMLSNLNSIEITKEAGAPTEPFKITFQDCFVNLLSSGGPTKINLDHASNITFDRVQTFGVANPFVVSTNSRLIRYHDILSTQDPQAALDPATNSVWETSAPYVRFVSTNQAGGVPITVSSAGMGINTHTSTAPLTVRGAQGIGLRWDNAFAGADRNNWGVQLEYFNNGDWNVMRSSGGSTGAPDTVTLTLDPNGKMSLYGSGKVGQQWNNSNVGSDKNNWGTYLDYYNYGQWNLMYSSGGSTGTPDTVAFTVDNTGKATAWGGLASGTNQVSLTGNDGIIRFGAYGYPAGTTNYISGNVMVQTNLSGTNYSTFNLATQDKYSSGGQTNSGPIGAEGGLAVTGAFTVNGQTLGGLISTSTVANAYQLITPSGSNGVYLVYDSPPAIDVWLFPIGTLHGSNATFTGTISGNGSGLSNVPPSSTVGTWIQNSNQLATFTPFMLHNTSVVTVIDPTNSNLQFIAQTNSSGLTIAISTNVALGDFGSITLDISNNTAQTLTFLTTNLYSSFTYNATNADVGTVLFWKPAYASNNLWRAKQLQ